MVVGQPILKTERGYRTSTPSVSLIRFPVSDNHAAFQETPLCPTNILIYRTTLFFYASRFTFLETGDWQLETLFFTRNSTLCTLYYSCPVRQCPSIVVVVLPTQRQPAETAVSYWNDDTV
jgi:hypothetical protein